MKLLFAGLSYSSMKRAEDYFKEAKKAADDAYEFLREVTGMKGLDEYFKTVRELKDCVVIFYTESKERDKAKKYIKKYKKKYAKLPVLDISLDNDADSHNLIYVLEIENTPLIMIYEGGRNVHSFVYKH